MNQIITIRAKSNGHDCWHKVRITRTKLPLLKRFKTGELMDVAELGEILESGWGEPPSDTIDYDAIDA
jgi:hypothetical protein